MTGPRQTRVSVPGKLILMGEHAAVYGRPALVAAIHLRLEATFSTAGYGQGVHFSLPQIRWRESTDWESILAYAADVRMRWQEFSRNPGAGFAQVGIGEPAHLIKVALGEAVAGLDRSTLPELHLRIDSQIPIGSGFGSSAAGAVAVVAGVLLHCGEQPAVDELERLALEVERRQHGFPSGVDHAAVLRGGLQWAVRRNQRPLQLERVIEGNAALKNFRVFHTGTPAESTGEVVSVVRAFRDRDPDRFESTLDRMEFSTRRFRKLVEADAIDFPAVLHSIRDFQTSLESLGVVPEAVCEIVRRIEAEGGAAKISGAGSIGGPGAGCLLVIHEDPSIVDRWEFLDPWIAYPLQLGGKGLQTEQFE